MEILKLKDLGFTYNAAVKPALADLNFSINEGELVLLCGANGCGKSTLLKLLKPELMPYGNLQGEMLFYDKPFSAFSEREMVADIGFVGHNDVNMGEFVWSEMAFNLESLGFSEQKIRTRLAEICVSLDLEKLFRKRICELSAGEKQKVQLAAALVLRPRLLLLDEPTALLDPVAAQEFFSMLKNIQVRLGMTVIISEHRLEQVIPLCDKMLVLEEGKLKVLATPQIAAQTLFTEGNSYFTALPAAIILYFKLGMRGEIPLFAADAQKMLQDFMADVSPERKSSHNDISIQPTLFADRRINNVTACAEQLISAKPVLIAKELGFKYQKEQDFVLQALNLELYAGEVVALCGANGCGKSTLLRLLSGIKKPLKGKVEVKGGRVLLPQNVRDIFTQENLYKELIMSKNEPQSWQSLLHKFNLQDVLYRYFGDLSSGELQKCALLRLLLKQPAVLMLDEPTVGLDFAAKTQLAVILNELAAQGMAILFVSHDMDFCATAAKRCALLFDRNIAMVISMREFLTENYYYTTQAALSASGIVKDAVTISDILEACYV